jgi:hypothetical protein
VQVELPAFGFAEYRVEITVQTAPKQSLLVKSWPCLGSGCSQASKSFHLADLNRGIVLLVVTLDGRGIGFTAIDGDRLRHAVPADRLGQEALGRPLIALLRQQKVNGLTVRTSGAMVAYLFASSGTRSTSQT